VAIKGTGLASTTTQVQVPVAAPPADAGSSGISSVVRGIAKDPAKHRDLETF
jgi:hypothetical protein